MEFSREKRRACEGFECVAAYPKDSVIAEEIDHIVAAEQLRQRRCARSGSSSRNKASEK
jgi:hypothetical protein